MALRIWDRIKSCFIETVAKVKSGSSWITKPVKYKSGGSWTTIQGTNFIPNYSTPDPEQKYKWGYISMLNQWSDQATKNKIIEVYTRILNARKYGVYVTEYKFKHYTSGEMKKSNAKNTFTLSSLSVPALQVYLSDISAGYDIIAKARQAVEHDYPELCSRWCWYEIANVTGDYRCSWQTSDSILLPYLPVDVENRCRAFAEDTLNFVIDKVKLVHNIEYNRAPYHINNKHYTAEQKIKIAKVIHDTLVVRNTYGSGTGPADGNLETWPALSNAVAGVNYSANPVCISYAKAFSYLCWCWGITCVIVYGLVNYDLNKGTSNGNHAWNMVTYEPITFLDNGYNNEAIWNEVDVTWDDPTGWNQKQCRWTYFNVTTASLEAANRHRSTINGGGANATLYSYPANATCTSYKKYINYQNGANSETYLYKW